MPWKPLVNLIIIAYLGQQIAGISLDFDEIRATYAEGSFLNISNTP